MKNNCQDFCIALAKFLNPNISAGAFPLCEAGSSQIKNTGYSSAAAGQGQESNVFAK